MKKINFKSIVMIVAAVLFVFATLVFANNTFIVPSGVNKVFDRDGNAYTPDANRAISVPAKYSADFINAGYAKLLDVTSCGTTGTCAGTTKANSKIYIGSVPMVAGSNVSTANVTALGFSDTNYICTASDATNTNAVKVSVVSASIVNFSVGANVTDVVNYICVGQ